MSASNLDKFLANWSSQARKGVLELMVLSALESHERYGYELVSHLNALGAIEVSDGTIYAILTRLKSDNLISTRWDHGDSGPPRKYYALTQGGAATLAAMRGIWTRIQRSLANIQTGGLNDV